MTIFLFLLVLFITEEYKILPLSTHNNKGQYFDSVLLFSSLCLSFSPALLNILCEEFLPLNVSAILFMMNTEIYGKSSAASQYFLQLTGYLGIPMISWNADSAGFEQVCFIFSVVHRQVKLICGMQMNFQTFY